MISYDNRDILAIFLEKAGSVAFRLTTILPAIASSCCCALLLYHPDVRRNFIIPGAIARIYATILGFVIAFRTRMAFGRYFDGVSYGYTMLSQWRDAFSSLSSFLEASIVEHQKMGHVDVVRELVISKARLAHWFSILVALAVQKLRGEEGEVGDDLCIERDVKNRFCQKHQCKTTSAVSRSSTGGEMYNKIRASAIEEHLQQEAMEEYGAGVQILGHVTPQERTLLKEANDSLLCVTKWILLEISSHSISGRLLIAPPILSRVYAEMSNAMMAFFQAMQIPLCPFPFPFAQFLQYALLWWIAVCPFAVLITLEDPAPELSNTWMALPLNYLACFGFVTLNEIAVELEEPFGEDDNDYPVHLQQWNVVWAMEDCYFTDVPFDFAMQMLGPDVMQQAYDCKQRIRPSIPAPSPPSPAASPPGSSASPTPNSSEEPQVPTEGPEPASPERAKPVTAASQVTALATNFQELRDAFDMSASMMETSSLARHDDIERVGKRFGGLLPGLSGPGPLELARVTKNGMFNKKMTKNDRCPTWSEVTMEAESNDDDFSQLCELVQTHRQITQALQAIVKQHRGQEEAATGPLTGKTLQPGGERQRSDGDGEDLDRQASITSGYSLGPQESQD